MFQPENQTKKYQVLFVDIDTGKIKIPKFQREFVWSKEQTAGLIDSILKGFPIGTFILWKTREELRHSKNIGNIELPEPPKGDPISYVLDGQQRITSLYAVRKGIRVTKDGKEINYQDICVNLDLDPDEDEQIVTVDPPENAPYISVYRLLNGSFTSFLDDGFTREQLSKIEIYQSRLTQYDFSTILISDYPLDIACDIFTRINTGGTELTLFEIMVAKTYDEARNFDLADQYQLLLNNNGTGKDLEDAKFDTVSSATILQCISAHLVHQVRRKDILRLNKNGVIDEWKNVKEGIFTAVDYIRSHLRVQVSQLLPYDTLLVPFSYFFIRLGNRQTTTRQDKLLTQYFFWAALTNRFSSGVEGKIAKDLDRMDLILKEEAPDYKEREIILTIEDLRWRWFNAGDAFCKAILCLYAYFTPHSFKSDGLLRLDNSWLDKASATNFHHFFPKSFLAKQGIPNWKANVILNITIVDDYLNKRTIGARAPSEYMKDFKKENRHLAETMKTHLIDDLREFGIWTDNYDCFIEMRGQRVLEELKKRLEPELD